MGIQYGFGTIVNVDKKPYLLTNRHIIYSKTDSWFRNIIIWTTLGTSIKISTEEYIPKIFKFNTQIDLALVPIF